MRALGLLACVAALALPALAGGESSPSSRPVVPDQAPATAATVVRALRASGARVKIEQRLEQPFFPVPATILEVDGEGVQVFAFRDARTAREQASRVSPDGRSIGTSQPLWIAPPHFYRRSNLVVLYLGEDEKLLARLERLLGKPFAGP